MKPERRYEPVIGVARKGFIAWMLYDATDTYTGQTLWNTRRMAQAEKEFQDAQNNLPHDGDWRIRKVHIMYA